MSTLSAAATSMNGTLHGKDQAFVGVSTDTRTLKRGELFVALEGPNFDGRDYVGQAREKGAVGAVVNALVEGNGSGLPQVVVNDSKRALGLLGSVWREQLGTTVIGITGSNGKTTLKEMTAACLSMSAPTLATQGNLNNDIGMPLMMTRFEEQHRYAVLEMGANHAGEIAYLTALAKPNVVAITNAAAAHLEGFGSIDGVAKAKGEILCGEPRPKIAVLNADDRYFEYWSTLLQDIGLLSFGIDNPADVRATNIRAESGVSTFELHVPGGKALVRLPLGGRHNVLNACAAAAIATSIGIHLGVIVSALETITPVSGRLQKLDGPGGSIVYDDSYNANPPSTIAAAEFLASRPGRSMLVLGDMAELGEDSPRLHREVGESAARAGIDRLYATGALSRNTVDGFGSGAKWFASLETLIDALVPDIGTGTNVLVKGSRSSRMERVVEALCGKQAGNGVG